MGSLVAVDGGRTRCRAAVIGVDGRPGPVALGPGLPSVSGPLAVEGMVEALVATVSVGAPRRFLLRRSGGGQSMPLSLGWGDLLVMGGTCQRTYQHAIPKVRQALPRISIMLRPNWLSP